MSKLTFHQLVRSMSDLLQAMHAEEGIDEVGSSAPTYKTMLKWMKTSDSARGTGAMTALFSHVDVTAFDEEGFTLLDTNYYDQCYRVVTSLRFHAPDDLRPWQYMELLPPQWVKMYTFTTSFMMQVKRTRCRNQTGIFTVPATAFERLMYLIATTAILSLKGRTSTVRTKGGDARGKKRKRTVLPPQDTQDAPVLFKANRQHTQKLAYAVQAIIRSWDIFSRTLGFADTDAMIAPYIYFDDEKLTFKCIRAREEGYARREQLKSLVGVCAPTSEQSECDEVAFQRPHDIDSSLRALISLFLDDFFSITQSGLLYTHEQRHDHELLKKLESINGHIPLRFADMPPETSEAINSLSVPKDQEDEPQRHAFPTIVPRNAVPKGTVAQRRTRKESVSARTTSKAKPMQVIQCSEGEDCICNPARNRLEKELEKYVRMYTCSFDELSEIDSCSCPSGGLEETGQLLLTDPPFNYRRLNEKENSHHDNISEEEMLRLSQLAHSFLHRGGHAIIFCAPLQFHIWHKCLKSDDFDPQFLVDSSPITVVSKPGHYFGDVYRKKTSLHPVTAWALHAMKSGLSLEENFDLVRYINYNHIPSRHAAWTNVIDEVGRLPKGEHLRGSRDGSDKSTSIFRPEQKNKALLKELICRFSKKGSQVIDPFAGTFSTAAACISLPEHRTFVGCELQPDVFTVAKRRLVEVLASSLLDKYCDIKTDSSGLLEDARLVHAHASYTSKPDRNWYHPDGFPGFQTLPSYLSIFVSSTWKKPEFHLEYGNNAVSEWPNSMKGALQCADIDSLLALECSHLNVCIASSTIQHPNAGDGLFAMKDFEKGETVGYYYGVLVYTNIGNRREYTKCYGEEGILGTNVSEFQIYGMRLSIAGHGIKVGEELVREAFVVPKRFCACSKINEPGYREEDNELVNSQLDPASARVANVTFVTKAITTLSELKSYSVVTVRASQNISAGEEFYGNYSRK